MKYECIQKTLTQKARRCAQYKGHIAFRILISTSCFLSFPCIYSEHQMQLLASYGYHGICASVALTSQIRASATWMLLIVRNKIRNTDFWWPVMAFMSSFVTIYPAILDMNEADRHDQPYRDLSLRVQQKTHKGQEASVFCVTDCTKGKRNGFICRHETEPSKYQLRVCLKQWFPKWAVPPPGGRWDYRSRR
jgi:hypothetical protein